MIRDEGGESTLSSLSSQLKHPLTWRHHAVTKTIT